MSSQFQSYSLTHRKLIFSYYHGKYSSQSCEPYKSQLVRQLRQPVLAQMWLVDTSRKTLPKNEKAYMMMDFTLQADG